MTEDEISIEMFRAAREEPSIEVLSWQGVGGKSYLTRSIRLTAGARRYLPDLVLLRDSELWIIEVKGSHEEARAEDEPKLVDLRFRISAETIRRQVSRGAKRAISDSVQVVFAVSYSVGDTGPGCAEPIVHIAWAKTRPDILAVLSSAS